MIKQYLMEREENLKNIIAVNKEKFEHNQIAIVELNNQIKELRDTKDEASQIFSVKAREDNSFRQQEINQLENSIAAYVSENNDFEQVINVTTEELEKIRLCLKELDDFNVSRETLNDNENNETYIQLKIGDLSEKNDSKPDKIIKSKQLIEKLQFCKNIVEIDSKRVLIELDNIIKELMG